MSICSRLTNSIILVTILLLLPVSNLKGSEQVYNVQFHQLASLTSDYVKKVLVERTNVEKFIFGNKICGYFKSRNVKRKNDKSELSIIPPCYKGKIEFWIRNLTSEYVLLKEVRFSNPAAPLTEIVKTKVRGNYDIPFTLTSIGIPDMKKGKKRTASMTIIVNRFGEIVWSYLVNKGKKRFQKYTIPQKISGSLYSIFVPHLKLDIVDIHNGLVSEYNLNGFEKHNDYINNIHHVLIYSKNIEEVITITDKYYQLKEMRPSDSLLTKVKKYASPGIPVLVNMIIKMNLRNGKFKPLWSPLDHFAIDKNKIPPLKKVKFSFTKHLRKVPYIKSEGLFGYDWNHLNHIQHIKNKGYLISLSDMDTISFLSEDFSKVLWTISSDKNSTLKMDKKRYQFKTAHHPYLDRDVLYVFDNEGIEGDDGVRNRVLSFRIDTHNKKAEFLKEFIPAKHFRSTSRGSVYVFGNSLLSYFPGSESGISNDTYISLNKRTFQEKGRLEIVNKNNQYKSYNATPLGTIDRVESLGFYVR